MAACVLLAASALWAQGHRVERNRVIVDPDHWQEWDFPRGTLDFDGDGAKPRFIRSQTNAARDAVTFAYGDGMTGGIRVSGTNLQQAERAIDGREDTYWEPALDAPLKDWWLEIDLGRVVWVRKIRVVFAEEGEGDPFLQFNVLTSNGLKAFSQSNTLSFKRAGRSEGLNKTQRIFEFDIEPKVGADEGFRGDLVQFVQIVATATDAGQAEEISESTWNQLPEALRGDVLYFRRAAMGVERPVDQSEYEEASAELRGSIRHFRRERPRLAEVEVWTGGDNIALDVLRRGGEIVGYGNLGAEVLVVDGDYTTFWSVEVGYSSLGFQGGLTDVVVKDPVREIFLDLGTVYWVNRLLFVFDTLSSGGAFPNYTINLSRGNRAPDGSFVYTKLGSRGDDGLEEIANGRFFYQDNPFPLTMVRYLSIDYRIAQSSIRSAIREIQLYGRGFVPQVSMTSDMIELGRDPRILSNISWQADSPPGTQLQIRTRSGNEQGQLIRYFNNSGTEVLEEKYRKLLSFQRGDSLVTVIPGSDWSNWSPFYHDSGDPIASPSPRRFLMIQASLLSDDPDQAALLRNLRVELANPLADRVIGEISPRTVAHRGQREILTLYLRPTFESGNRGFDQILVKLPPGTEMELLDARFARESELESDGGRLITPGELERVESGPDSLWVRFPEIVDRNTSEIVVLRFAGPLYLASSVFPTWVGLSEAEEQVWQQVDAGGVVAAAAGRDLAVQTPFTGSLVGEVEVKPNPFTPNSDGVNDRVEFKFPIFRVQGGKDLILEVYSLSGELVRKTEHRVSNAAGRQRLSWDGRDGGGGLLPPGMYICRVGVDVDDESAEGTMVVLLVASVY